MHNFGAVSQAFKRGNNPMVGATVSVAVAVAVAVAVEEALKG